MSAMPEACRSVSMFLARKLFRLVCLVSVWSVGWGAMAEDATEPPNPPLETLAVIRENVALLKRVMRANADVVLGFDAESIEWLDDYINRNRHDLDPESIDNLVDVIGSFLGEAIIASYGGRWAESEHGLGVFLGGKSFAFPFSKVRKHLEDGSEDSIRRFYRVVPLILDGSLTRSSD